MSTKENVAIERRIEALERQIIAIEPVRIRTTLVVCDRGDEPIVTTVEEVIAAKDTPPQVTTVEVIPDLDCIIDAESGVHVLRHEVEHDHLAEFEALCEKATRFHDVRIHCHPAQLPLIRSCLPLTEIRGGARAGKTIILVWWLFRQWLLRGHAVDAEHLEAAVFWWIREDREKLWKYGVQWLLRMWPPVFVGKLPDKNSDDYTLHLLDGSMVDFRHANFSGSKAGTNLRSANVEAVVVDEKSAIYNRENWIEITNRVAQTHGPICTATTPTAGHWSEHDGEGAEDTGGAVFAAHVDRWMNPWVTIVGSLADMLRDRMVTKVQLEEQILRDPQTKRLRDREGVIEAAKDSITDPDRQRTWLGRKVPVGLTMWRNWREELIVRDNDGLRDFIETDEWGRLENITEAIVGEMFNRDDKPRPRRFWIGQDYNIAPCVGVILQLFGRQHRPKTWHVLVVDEVAVDGPTVNYAKTLAKRYRQCAGFGDPRGHMPGRHESHGPKSNTDAAELEAHGHYLQPAGGRSKGGRAAKLPRKSKANVMHRLMDEGRFLVHARCVGLIEAMRSEIAGPDGLTKKTPGPQSKSDKMSAYTDSTGYGLYPVFKGEFREAA